jgi:hypothetical protein
MLGTPQVLSAADTLARRAAADGVLDNQLALVLAHLKRHRDVAGTLSLLAELETSPFAKRSQQTQRQFAALGRHVRESLHSVSGWQDAAAIVGWARRLAAFHRPVGTGRPGPRSGTGGARSPGRGGKSQPGR